MQLAEVLIFCRGSRHTPSEAIRLAREACRPTERRSDSPAGAAGSPAGVRPHIHKENGNLPCSTARSFLFLVEHISRYGSQLHHVTGQDTDGIVEPLGEELPELFVSIPELDE